MHKPLQAHTLYGQTGGKLEVVGKPCLALRRAVEADVAGSTKGLLSTEGELSLHRLSPLDVKSKDPVHGPEPRREKRLHFGSGVLVWGHASSPLTMSHSHDRARGRSFLPSRSPA